MSGMQSIVTGIFKRVSKKDTVSSTEKVPD